MINWGALQGGGVQNALASGLQMGQIARQNRQENELMALQERRQGLAEQQASAQAQQQQWQQRRADLPMMVRLLESATDDATYQRNMGVAQQYGIDVSNLPQQFDPAWRDQQLSTMKLLSTPEGQSALSTIGKEVADMGFQPGTPEFSAKVSELWTATQSRNVSWQPGGGAAEVNPVTGQTRMIVQPGTMPAQDAAPTAFNPQTGETLVLRNGQWVPQGGTGGNVGGGF
jgi:hypothetical protein